MPPSDATALPASDTADEPIASAASSSGDLIVWIDCEMTGLSLEADALVEIAAVITDYDLNPIAEGIDVVIKPPKAALDQMGEFVTEMHTSSGLIGDLAQGVSLEEAEATVVDYLRLHLPEGCRPPLAGNSVGTDRGFIARDMPTLEGMLHYRIIDVSSIKELSRRWYPRAYFASPPKHGGHRALADILESIAELRYYREAVFVAPPGNDSASLKRMAAQHEIPSA